MNKRTGKLQARRQSSANTSIEEKNRSHVSSLPSETIPATFIEVIVRSLRVISHGSGHIEFISE